MFGFIKNYRSLKKKNAELKAECEKLTKDLKAVSDVKDEQFNTISQKNDEIEDLKESLATSKSSVELLRKQVEHLTEEIDKYTDLASKLNPNMSSKVVKALYELSELHKIND